MKRFMIAAVLAAALGLGTAHTADAQYIVQYNRVTPSGGVVTNQQLSTLGSYQNYNSYVSPLGLGRQNLYYTDIFGNTFSQSRYFNAWYGVGVTRGYYQPSPLFYPYNRGYYYNFYGRRW